MDFAPLGFVIDSAKFVVHIKQEKKEKEFGHQLLFFSRTLESVLSNFEETS